MGSIDVMCNDLDNVTLCAFAMKDKYYVMMLISYYGTHDWVGDETFRTIGGDRIGIK